MKLCIYIFVKVLSANTEKSWNIYLAINAKKAQDIYSVQR
jgi:hypothetical protein